MPLKTWVSRIALGAIMLGGVLACQITDQFIAQTAPTPTRTRTPRPTFTPPPLPTQTNTPAPTVPPTLPSAPTKTATRRPLPTATKRPATAVPPPPVVAGPTASPYQWHVNPPGCEHAGGVFVKARVYADKNDPNSGAPDMLVVLGDGAGNRFDIPSVTTTYDGTYSFTLSADGAPPYKGTVYVWLIDSGGKRISDIGGPMVFDGAGPDVGCWHGWVDFWR